MKNLEVLFVVATNTNLYYATSLKAAESFCKKNDLVIMNCWVITPSTPAEVSALKCGHGVYCKIDDN